MTPNSLCCRSVIAFGCMCIFGQPASSTAQILASSGDHFTVDGVGRFIVFASYFHGLERPAETLSVDLSWLKSKGVMGVRVWPNATNPRLMSSNGQLDVIAVQRLKSIATQAALRGMIVDITFTRETVPLLPNDPAFTIAEYQQAITSTATALSDRRNILFDLQNEWNNQPITITDLNAIRSAVKSQHPALLITASTSGNSHREAAVNAFDVLAYHGSRDGAGRWADETDELVAGLRAQLAGTPRKVAPIYLQEPNRFRYPVDSLNYYDNTTAHYWTSAQNAKRAGAAGWTFHTAASFGLSSATPLSELLLPGERNVLESLAAKLAQQSTWGIQTGGRAAAPR
jgi:hypothetical protein